MNQNKKLPIIAGCIAMLICPLLLCGVLSFFPSNGWSFYPLVRPSIDRNNINDVNWSFSYSLMLGDVEIAKSLTSASQHSRLDNWFVSNKAFSCPTYWLFTNRDFLEGVQGGGGGLCEEDNRCEFSGDYRCYRSERLVYLISVEDTKIQKIDNNWVIIDWKEICQKIENEPMTCN